MRRLTHFILAIGIALSLSVLRLMTSPDSVWADSNRIVVLNGQDSKPYQDVLAGLQQSLVKQGITLAVEIHALIWAPPRRRRTCSPTSRKRRPFSGDPGECRHANAVRAKATFRSWPP